MLLDAVIPEFRLVNGNPTLRPWCISISARRRHTHDSRGTLGYRWKESGPFLIYGGKFSVILSDHAFRIGVKLHRY